MTMSGSEVLAFPRNGAIGPAPHATFERGQLWLLKIADCPEDRLSLPSRMRPGMQSKFGYFFKLIGGSALVCMTLSLDLPSTHSTVWGGGPPIVAGEGGTIVKYCSQVTFLQIGDLF